MVMIYKRLVMNKKVIYLLSVPFLMSNASYELEQGDSISLLMKKNGIIKNYSELDKIEEVLRINNLDWQSARNLPIGYSFVTEKKESTPVIISKKSKRIKKQTNKNSYSVELGVFNETISRRDSTSRNIYSDLSQYALIAAQRQLNFKTSLGVKLRVNNHLYSESSSQAIESDFQKTLISPSININYSFNDTHSVSSEAMQKSFLAFDIDSDQQTKMDNVSDTVLSVGYNYAFKLAKKYSNTVSVNIGKSAGDYNYNALNLKFASKIEKYSIFALFSDNSFEYLQKNQSEKQLSIGLGTFF